VGRHAFLHAAFKCLNDSVRNDSLLSYGMTHYYVYEVSLYGITLYCLNYSVRNHSILLYGMTHCDSVWNDTLLIEWICKKWLIIIVWNDSLWLCMEWHSIIWMTLYEKTHYYCMEWLIVTLYGITLYYLNYSVWNDSMLLYGRTRYNDYGVATTSRLLIIIGLFCKRAL